MNIFVGNLDFKVSDQDLMDIFSDYGTVSSAKVLADKFTGKSRGFGFVTMEDPAEAKKAISELNGFTFKNRDLVVNEAKPKNTSYSR